MRPFVSGPCPPRKEPRLHRLGGWPSSSALGPTPGGKEGAREATSPCYREGNEAQIAGADASGNGATQGQSWGSIPGSLLPVWSA